jgi:hypothetical protein
VIVRLKSPFNGEIRAWEFVDGRLPTGETLEAMVRGGFVVVDESPLKPKAKRKDDAA